MSAAEWIAKRRGALNPDLIELATVALVNSRREHRGLSPIDRMPWAHTSDIERRHVAAALEAAAPIIAAKALRDAADAAARTSDGYGWVGDSVRDWLRARAATIAALSTTRQENNHHA